MRLDCMDGDGIFFHAQRFRACLQLQIAGFQPRFSHRDFFLRRLLRVGPLYYFSLMAIFLILPLDWIDIDKSMPSFFLVQSWVPGCELGGIGVGWFTSVIVAFYFLFPFLCRWVFSMSVRKLTLLVTSLYVVSWLYAILLPPVMFNDWYDVFAPMRLIDCFYGIVLFRLFEALTLWRNQRMSSCVRFGGWVELAVVVSVAVGFVVSLMASVELVPAVAYAIPVAIVIFVFAGTEIMDCQGCMGRFLASRPMTFFGGITFEIYFIHALVLSKFGATSFFRGWDFPLWIVIPLTASATLVGAICWNKAMKVLLARFRR